MVLSLPSRWLRGAGRGAYRAEQRHRDHDRLRTWRAVWSTTAEGCGLGVAVIAPAGQTLVVPPLLAVIDPPDGAPLTLVVELLRGQLPDDVIAVGPRLALALDAAVVTVVPRSGRTVGIVLHDVDPLAEPFRVTLPRLRSVHEPLVLGRAENGSVLTHALAAPAHVCVQGQNGSGKSRATYALLGQVAHADDVLIAGSDITGLLLGAPWEGTRHRGWQATGTGDLAAHADVLDALVDEMDRRLSTMPRGVDALTPSPSLPLLLVVMEELPGLLRALATLPKPARGERSLTERVRGALLRLLSEGRKAAVRVLALAQRAEAETVGGGYAREQFALTVSFRVPADSLAMLHGEDARALGAVHRTADPGVAVVSAPGRALARMRAPHVGDYADYCVSVDPAPTLPVARVTLDEDAAAVTHRCSSSAPAGTHGHVSSSRALA